MSSSISSLYLKITTPKIRASLTALLVFLLPFERIPSLDIFSSTIRLSQLVGLALIFVSVGPIIDFYKIKPRLPKLLLPAFILSYLVSAVLATDLKRAAMIWIFTVFVALVGSAIAATFTANELPRLEKYLYISTAIVLVVGFYQYFGDVFGLSPAMTGLRDIYTKEVFGFPRIQSTALEPLYYGSFLLIPYCLLLAKRLIGYKGITTAQTILFVALTAQVLLTVSRGAIYGGILATALLVILLLFKKGTSFKRVAVAVGLLLVAAAFALFFTWLPTKIINTPKTTNNTEKLVKQASNFTSQDDRKRNRLLAAEAFKQDPVLGIGPGNFSQYAVTKYPKYAKAAPVIVNNEPLELLAEAGIIGFVLFIAFVGWFYITVSYGYIKGRYNNRQLVYWVPAILVYLVTLAIQYQTFSTLYIMHVWVVIGLLMAFGSGQVSGKATK